MQNNSSLSALALRPHIKLSLLATLSTSTSSSWNLTDLDAISKKINSIEKSFVSIRLPFRFIYIFKSELVRSRNTSIFTGIDYCLAWSINEKGNPRLSYFVFETPMIGQDYDSEEDTFCILPSGKPFLKVAKPLIETKAAIRLEVDRELKVFAEEMCQFLDNECLRLVMSDSPNFMGNISSLQIYRLLNGNFCPFCVSGSKLTFCFDCF